METTISYNSRFIDVNLFCAISNHLFNSIGIRGCLSLLY